MYVCFSQKSEQVNIAGQEYPCETVAFRPCHPFLFSLSIASCQRACVHMRVRGSMQTLCFVLICAPLNPTYPLMHGSVESMHACDVRAIDGVIGTI